MNNEKNDKETLEMPKKKENLNDILDEYIK